MAPRAANGRAALRRPRGQLPAPLGGNGAILAGRLASPEPRFVAYRFHRESSHKEAASGQPRGARRPLLTRNARLLLSARSSRRQQHAAAGPRFPINNRGANDAPAGARAGAAWLPRAAGGLGGGPRALRHRSGHAARSAAALGGPAVACALCSGSDLRQPPTGGCTTFGSYQLPAWGFDFGTASFPALSRASRLTGCAAST